MKIIVTYRCRRCDKRFNVVKYLVNGNDRGLSDFIDRTANKTCSHNCYNDKNSIGIAECISITFKEEED
jgi:hypothetical protein